MTTLNQWAKFAGICAAIIAALGLGGGAFVYWSGELKAKGRLEATVDQHTKTMDEIKKKVDAMAEQVGAVELPRQVGRR